MPQSKMPEEVKKLTEQLQHKDWLVRIKAAETLGQTKHPSAIPHLIKTLQDSESLVRCETAKALGIIGHKSAMPHLIKTLQDPDGRVRYNAALALESLSRERDDIYQRVRLLKGKPLEPELFAELIHRIVQQQPRNPYAQALLYLHQTGLLRPENATVIYPAMEALTKGAYKPLLQKQTAPSEQKKLQASLHLYLKQLRAMKGKLK